MTSDVFLYKKNGSFAGKNLECIEAQMKKPDLN